MEKYEELLESAYKKLPEVSSVEAVRLEIPLLKSSLSGNKTIISNLDAVAKAVRRDINHVFKFFQRELAASGDMKGTEAIFIGKFKNEFLNAKVEKYVKEYIKKHLANGYMSFLSQNIHKINADLLKLLGIRGNLDEHKNGKIKELTYFR